MKTLYTLFIFLLTATAWSQNGQISGKVLDEETGEPIPFAVITLSIGDSLCYGANSDFDGLFRIVQVKPGQYDMEIRFIGYQSIKKKVTIAQGQTYQQNVSLSTEAPCLCIEEEYIFIDGIKIRLAVSPIGEEGAPPK